MFKRVYVVCDESVDAKEREDPNAEVWTLSDDPNVLGWETDMGCSGYGLTKDKAEFYAKCINEKVDGVAK